MTTPLVTTSGNDNKRNMAPIPASLLSEIDDALAKVGAPSSTTSSVKSPTLGGARRSSSGGSSSRGSSSTWGEENGQPDRGNFFTPMAAGGAAGARQRQGGGASVVAAAGAAERKRALREKRQLGPSRGGPPASATAATPTPSSSIQVYQAAKHRRGLDEVEREEVEEEDGDEEEKEESFVIFGLGGGNGASINQSSILPSPKDRAAGWEEEASSITMSAGDDSDSNVLQVSPLRPAGGAAQAAEQEQEEEEEKNKEEEEEEDEDPVRTAEEDLAASEALARAMMEEEALSVYTAGIDQLRQQLSSGAHEGVSREDMAAMQAIMEEDERVVPEAVYQALQGGRRRRSAEGGEEEGGEGEEEGGDSLDELSYEGLLELGGHIGDVRRERWMMRASRVIASLPCSTHDGVSERGGGDKCLVCLEPYTIGQSVRTLPCSHEFHQECVDGWLARNSTCPTCIASVEEKDEDT